MNLSNLTSLTLLNEQPDPPILEPTPGLPLWAFVLGVIGLGCFIGWIGGF